MRLRSIFAMILLVLASCTAGKSYEFTGTWEIAEESLQMFPGMQARPRLILSQDGSFNASDLPGEFVGRPAYVTGQGSWYTSHPYMFLRFSKINDKEDFLRAQLPMTDEEAPRLVYYRGDRNHGTRIFIDKH